MENVRFLTLLSKMHVALLYSLGELSFPAIAVGSPVRRKPLSFHSVSFGGDSSFSSLRRMAHLALGIQNSGSRDRGPATSIPSAFTVALDTVSIPSIPREN